MTPVAAPLTETACAEDPPRYHLSSWRERFGVTAGITGRDGGFNLGLGTDEPVAAITARWKALFASFRPGFRRFVLGLQEHDTVVSRHDEGPAGWLIQPGVDAHLTRLPGVLMLVTVADCVPVYLLHPPSGAMALLHAGWRGIAAGILEQGITELSALGCGSAKDIVMHCGVSICGECYEVGPEVVAAVGGAERAGRSQLDLRDVLAGRAAECGVRDVTISEWCTAHDAPRFYSHRRSNGRDGRMVAFLGRSLP
ncbi:MAG TPA: polyphenol oxidase family protein [Gemmatimonadales bacterium]